MQRWHHAVADTSRELAGVPRKNTRPSTSTVIGSSNDYKSSSSSSSSSSPKGNVNLSSKTNSNNNNNNNNGSSPATMRSITKAMITKNDTRIDSSRVSPSKRNSFNVGSTFVSSSQSPQYLTKGDDYERRYTFSSQISQASSYGSPRVNSNNNGRQRSRSPSQRNGKYNGTYDPYDFDLLPSSPPGVNMEPLPFSPDGERYKSSLGVDTSPLSQAVALNEVIKVVQSELQTQDLSLIMSDIHRGYTHAQRKDMNAQDVTIMELMTALEHRDETLSSLEKEIHGLRGADREAKEARARAAEAEVALASALTHAQERVTDLERQWREADKRAEVLSNRCRTAEETLSNTILQHRKELLEATTSLQAQVTSLTAMITINQAVALADGAMTPGRGTPVPDDDDAPSNDEEPPTPLMTIKTTGTNNNSSSSNNTNGNRSSIVSRLNILKRKPVVVTESNSPIVHDNKNSNLSSLPSSPRSAGVHTNSSPNRRNSSLSHGSSEGQFAARSIIQNPEDTASVISKAIEEAVEARIYGLQQENKHGSMMAELETKLQTTELALNKAEKEVNDLRNDVLAARGERDALHQTIIALKADIAGKEILQREIQELRVTLEESETTKEDYAKEVRKYAAERDALHQTVTRLSAEKDRLSSLDLHVRTLELRLQEAQQGGHNAEHTAKLTNQEMDLLKQQYLDQQVQHERAIVHETTKREQEVGLAKAEIAGLQQQLREIQEKYKQITEVLEEEKSKARDELGKHSTYIEHASSNIHDLKSQIQKLEKELQSSKATTVEDNQTIEKVQEELHHSQQENRSHRKQIEMLIGERDAIKATLTVVKEVASSTGDELDETKTKLQQAEEKLQKFTNFIDFSPQLRSAQGEIHRLSESLSVAMGEREVLKNTLSAVKEAYNEETDKSTKLEQRISQLEKDIVTIKQENLVTLSKTAGIPTATKEAIRRATQAEGERDALMNMVKLLKVRIAEMEQ